MVIDDDATAVGIGEGGSMEVDSERDSTTEEEDLEEDLFAGGHHRRDDEANGVGGRLCPCIAGSRGCGRTDQDEGQSSTSGCRTREDVNGEKWENEREQVLRIWWVNGDVTFAKWLFLWSRR